MAQRATSADANQEVLRLRKELIQHKAQIADLNEALDEKTNDYLKAIKERDKHKETLQSAGDNIKNLEAIVAQKVLQATADKARQLATYEVENKNFKERAKLWDKEKEDRDRDLRNHKEEIKSLQQRLSDNIRNSIDPTKPRLDNFSQLNQVRESSELKVKDLMKEINTLSNQMENVIAENRTLRQMANVPANYGIKLDEIKLHDRDKIDDFKKLIKVLQDDNYKLEEERAKLKHALKVQSMMYKTESTNPNERYKGLDKDQIFLVDQYVLRLLQGESETNGDIYYLKRENEALKAQIEVLKSKSFQTINEQFGKMTQNGKFGDNKDQQNSQIQASINELKILIQQMGERNGGTRNDVQIPSSNPNIIYKKNNYLDPKPDNMFDGEIQRGRSFKFNTNLDVVNPEGQPGINSSNVYEHAFLQLNLQECFQLIKQKDEQLKESRMEIDSLHRRIKTYLLTQDNIYKDYIRMENSFLKREKDLKEKVKIIEDELKTQQSALKKTENTIQAMQGGSESIKARVVELTMQNAILDNNLVKLTRKYSSLEEQEKLLRREYHAKDNDLAEKDYHVQKRICDLKEWKAKAIEQLRFLQTMIEESKPLSEFQIIQGECEIAKQKAADYIMRNEKLAGMYGEQIRKARANQEAYLKLKNMEEDKEQALLEYEVLKKRLEHFDPVFKFENGVFLKIATIIKRSGVTVESAFNAFDTSGDNQLSKAEFKSSLEQLHIVGSRSQNTLTSQEFDCLWNALDADNTGYVDHKEFARKLEYYGLRSMTQEERILTQMVDAVKRNNKDGNTMRDLFSMFDRNGKSFITREDFSDLLYSINVKIEPEALNNLLDKFWQDKTGGIDYNGFLRMFERYQIKVDRVKNSSDPVQISDNAIEVKKQMFDRIDKALKDQNRKIGDIFRKADSDHSSEINFEEFLLMIRQMQFTNISTEIVKEIFNSIDIDQNGLISLPELVSDFNVVCATNKDDLLNENKLKRRDQQKAQVGDNNDDYQSKVQLTTRIEMLKAEKRQLNRKLDTHIRICRNSEESLAILTKSYNSVEAQLMSMQQENYKIKEELNKMKQDAITSIPKDKAENMKVENAKLKDLLVETRAGLLSYKSMNLVISDQVKNLKLSQERKKDEHENLTNALREMQSVGADQERLGKLYFIIMLSRWQEASVNRRYEGVLQEVKELRVDLMNAESEANEFQAAYNKFKSEHRNCKKELDVKINQNAIQSDKANHANLVLLNHRIQDLVDNLSEGQELLLNMKSKYNEAQLSIDVFQVQAEGAKKALNDILNKDSDELIRKMVQQSEEHQKIRLNEMRANRKQQELEEKLKYMNALLKNKHSEVVDMEEKLSQAEGEKEIVKQMYEKKHTELFKRAFGRNGKFDFNGNDEGDDNQQAQQDGKLNRQRRAQSRGTTQFNDGDKLTRSASNVENNLQNRILENGNYRNQNQSDLTASWTKPIITNDINRLQKQIEEMGIELQRKQHEIERYKSWQLGDKYLTQDELLKDAISDHKAQTSQLQEKEHKEMQDAAYQTIKTLQEMLDKKNESIRAKEDQVARMRQQMADQRDIDAQTIAKLREQISITGQTTLAKMQEIVSQHDISNQVMGKKSQVNLSNNDKHSVNELTKLIQDKDNTIKRLLEEKNSRAISSQAQHKNRDEKTDEIARLKQELTRGERNRLELEDLKKKHENLKKEKEKQTQEIQKLKNAQIHFKEELLKFESVRVNLEESNNQLSLKDRQAAQVKDNERKLREDKISILQKQRDEQKDQIMTCKIKIDDLERDVSKAQESSKKDREQLEESKKLISKIQQENKKLEVYIRNLEEDQKIGGQIGAMTYSEQTKKIQDLEQEKMILESQTKTVVAYNKDNGTYEYIGNTTPLDLVNDITSIREILDKLRLWVEKQHRLTVAPIFRALDRQNSGELTQDQIIKGFEKIGKHLRDSELKLLKSFLDEDNSGYFKYEPLIRELQGIRTTHFTIKSFIKLSQLIEAKGWDREKFRTALEINHLESMNREQFKKAINDVSPNDFSMQDEEIIPMFKAILNKQKFVESDQIPLSKLIDQVLETQKARAIEKIRKEIKRKDLYLVDLLVKFDRNRDGKLTYNEAEELLREVGVFFNNDFWNNVLVKDLLDPGKRNSSISFDTMKWYFGGGAAVQGLSENVDFIPKQDRIKLNLPDGVSRNMDIKVCRNAARQISANNINLYDILNQKDIEKDQILTTEVIVQAIIEKLPLLQEGQVKTLVDGCDPNQRGFLVIPAFVNKVTELALETPQESALRRLASNVHRQAVNLNKDMARFDRQDTGRLDRESFKQAIKHQPFGFNDTDIDLLFDVAKIDNREEMDLKQFIIQVKRANTAKAPDTIQRERGNIQVPTAQTNQTSVQKPEAMNSYEIERKYEKTLKALKQEIEELNKEIKVARKEVKDSNKRAQDFQKEIENLQSLRVDRKSKTPKDTEIDSENQYTLQEVQKLKDEIYHAQQVNTALSKTIQVDLKAELSKLTQEKESLEHKLKVSQEKLRVKTIEVNQLVGKPMDQLQKREEREELRQKQIDELQKENQELTDKQKLTSEKLLKTEERLLDLKFEKETFDLQYARLQKRITDLEHYKLESSQLSAVLKNQHQAELDKIRDETEKLRGDSLNKQPGDSVKLRTQKTRTAAELETVVEQLKRVVDKQRVENEQLKKQVEQLETITAKGTNEPALRQKIEMLQRVVHSYEMQDVKTSEKDLTIKKLIFANETLRKDLEREIERFDLLQGKYKDLLIKCNISSKENERNQKALFTMTTGAHMNKYQNFLDDQGEFNKHNKSKMTEDPGTEANEDIVDQDDLNDSLNKINKAEARGKGYSR